MAETGVQYLRRLTEQRAQAEAARQALIDWALEDDDLGITWLCDLGDHDGCDGYACECCARGHAALSGPQTGQNDPGRTDNPGSP